MMDTVVWRPKREPFWVNLQWVKTRTTPFSEIKSKIYLGSLGITGPCPCVPVLTGTMDLGEQAAHSKLSVCPSAG